MMLMDSTAPITVHNWLPGSANKEFISLQAAIEYAGEHIDHLMAIEILIRTGSHRYVIIAGNQLFALVVRVSLSERRKAANFNGQSPTPLPPCRTL
ncbi:hypothetical protein HJA87_12115 [Rhizobium bangladeshense]|uniref:Uncharacterized protein n=1 Tax=Rhizobium bangladeshense TaxID=1138189 RepID=A0ABS7LH71_9HYPH|nr:hypothetical protein [Rhizobium bangladeshense]MBY3590623.1 hypothetical protein [Rhizobium bangladeshense]